MFPRHIDPHIAAAAFTRDHSAVCDRLCEHQVGAAHHGLYARRSNGGQTVVGRKRIGDGAVVVQRRFNEGRIGRKRTLSKAFHGIREFHCAGAGVYDAELTVVRERQYGIAVRCKHLAVNAGLINDESRTGPDGHGTGSGCCGSCEGVGSRETAVRDGEGFADVENGRAIRKAQFIDRSQGGGFAITQSDEGAGSGENVDVEFVIRDGIHGKHRVADHRVDEDRAARHSERIDGEFGALAVGFTYGNEPGAGEVFNRS